MICRMTKQQRAALVEMMNANISMYHACVEGAVGGGALGRARDRLDAAAQEFNRVFSNESEQEDNVCL